MEDRIEEIDETEESRLENLEELTAVNVSSIGGLKKSRFTGLFRSSISANSSSLVRVTKSSASSA